MDQSEDPRGGASVARFCSQLQVGMATVYLTATWQRTHSVLRFLKNQFLSTAFRSIKCKDVFCVNGPLICELAMCECVYLGREVLLHLCEETLPSILKKTKKKTLVMQIKVKMN